MRGDAKVFLKIRGRWQSQIRLALCFVSEIAFFDHWDDLFTLSACSTIITWKTLKDYLQSQGVAISPLTPRMVIKEAFAAGIISDGQIWIDMLDHRNLLSHTYDEEVLDETLEAIASTYMATIDELHRWFAQQQT